jgi:hypothetical protein
MAKRHATKLTCDNLCMRRWNYKFPSSEHIHRWLQVLDCHPPHHYSHTSIIFTIDCWNPYSQLVTLWLWAYVPSHYSPNLLDLFWVLQKILGSLKKFRTFIHNWHAKFPLAKKILHARKDVAMIYHIMSRNLVYVISPYWVGQCQDTRHTNFPFLVTFFDK